MKNFIYENEKTKAISFPIGGIGTGCIGLGGNGRLLDIEIFNRPNKGSHCGYTHFAIKAEDEEKVISAKILNSDLQPDYMGNQKRPIFQGYGFGPDRASLAGVPHFKTSTFTGTYPIAEIDFIDDGFPATVKMVAFNPLIPSNEFDSSLPSAFFEFEIQNTSNKKLTFSLAMSCNNYYANANKKNATLNTTDHITIDSNSNSTNDVNNNNATTKNAIHTIVNCEGKKGIFLSNDGCKDNLDYGDLTIVSDAEDTVCQQYWYRGNWFDSLHSYWTDFTEFGPMKNRIYESEKLILDLSSSDDIATIMSRIELEPSECKKIKFIMAWSMPLMNNHWQITDPELTEEEKKTIRKESWKNYYATHFETSLESATYSLSNFDRLYRDTRLFQEALFSSTMPEAVLDAVSANISILKSPTCLRLTDGSFYAFEGCHHNQGSCEGTCTHV